MSYMRVGYPLRWFKGESKYYVFPHADGYIEDYGARYTDNESFVELIGNIIERETNKEYADKIVKILAKKLKIQHRLRNG